MQKYGTPGIARGFKKEAGTQHKERHKRQILITKM